MFIVLLIVSIIAELALYTINLLWNNKKIAVFPLVLLTSIVTALPLLQPAQIWTGLFVFVGIFRLINLLRVAEGRMKSEYLRINSRRSAVILGLAALLLSVCLQLTLTVPGTLLQQSVTLALLQFVAALCVFTIVAINIHRTKFTPTNSHYSDSELPTVSVAIPARNETQDLEACLKSLLANNYPKLEILVYDDCSQDKTSDIIKSFAHDGVRFVRGEEPDHHWLPKNFAYQKLSQEALGDYILFCGVDTRFANDAIRNLISQMIAKKLEMISVMPRRLMGITAATIVQPMRYWWELAVPRFWFGRPPVLSTVFVVQKDSLERVGGFSAVSHSILPETYFAKKINQDNAYNFVRASNLLDIQTLKPIEQQRQTAVRTRYPQVHRRLELVLLISIFELMFFFAPFVLLLIGAYFGYTSLTLISAVTLLVLVATHVYIVRVSNPVNTLIALINLPIVIVTDLILGYTSMIRYEFGEVTWKDRNVCIPIMHVEPKKEFLQKLR